MNYKKMMMCALLAGSMQDAWSMDEEEDPAKDLMLAFPAPKKQGGVGYKLAALFQEFSTTTDEKKKEELKKEIEREERLIVSTAFGMVMLSGMIQEQKQKEQERKEKEAKDPSIMLNHLSKLIRANAEGFRRAEGRTEKKNENNKNETTSNTGDVDGV